MDNTAETQEVGYARDVEPGAAVLRQALDYLHRTEEQLTVLLAHLEPLD